MKYTVYKTTNIITGSFYIGVHKTENPDDSYLGSGKALKAALKSYGRENFTKEVLFVYDTSNEAYKKEKELVTPMLVSLSNCYNLTEGGVPTIDVPWERRLEYSRRLTGENHPMYGKRHSEESKQKIAASGIGRTASEETRRKMSASEKGHNRGKGRKLSEEDKKKKSEAALRREKVTCPWCDRSMEPSNAARWHFDNCKFNPSSNRSA